MSYLSFHLSLGIVQKEPQCWDRSQCSIAMKVKERCGRNTDDCNKIQMLYVSLYISVLLSGIPSLKPLIQVFDIFPSVASRSTKTSDVLGRFSGKGDLHLAACGQ